MSQVFALSRLLSLWVCGCSSTKTIHMSALKMQYNSAVANASIAWEDEICHTLPDITIHGMDDRLKLWIRMMQLLGLSSDYSGDYIIFFMLTAKGFSPIARPRDG